MYLNVSSIDYAYRSAPTKVSTVLTIKFPSKEKVLPAKIRKERLIANIMAVLVFLD